MATTKKKTNKAPSPAQLRARRNFIKMVRAKSKAAKAAKRANGTATRRPATRRRNSTTGSEVHSPTRTRTSTEALTSGNVTVTGGAGAGATTRVGIYRGYPKKKNAVVSVMRNGRRIYGAAAQAVLKKRNSGKKPAKATNRKATGTIKKRRLTNTFKPFAGAVSVRKYFRSAPISAWKDAEKRGQQRLFDLNSANTRRRTQRLNGRRVLGIPTARRRNPSTGELYEQFQGRASVEALAMVVPDNAPQDLYMLGSLATLETDSDTYTFEPAEAALVADKNGNLWIAGDVQLDANQDLGELQKLSYITTKDHINPGEEIEYVHTLGEDGGALPSLCTDREGLLLIEGGDYWISPDGIVD